MSEIPDDVMEAARTCSTEWHRDSLNRDGTSLAHHIALAISAERRRCEELSNTIARDVRNGDAQRFTAAKISSLIKSGSNTLGA